MGVNDKQTVRKLSLFNISDCEAPFETAASIYIAPVIDRGEITLKYVSSFKFKENVKYIAFHITYIKYIVFRITYI